MALLVVLSEELVFDRSNEYELQRPLVFRNTSSNLVAFRLKTNTPPGLIVLDPPMGILEQQNTIIINVIMDPTIPNAEGEFYKLSIEAIDVTNYNIDLVSFWANITYNDDPWMRELEIVILDPEMVDDRQADAENFNLNELTQQFSKLELKVEKLRAKKKNQKLDFMPVVIIIIVILAVLCWLFRSS